MKKKSVQPNNKQRSALTNTKQKLKNQEIKKELSEASGQTSDRTKKYIKAHKKTIYNYLTKKNESMQLETKRKSFCVLRDF